VEAGATIGSDDVIDLIDFAAARLEQTRAIACSVAEQIESASLESSLARQLSGEIGAMHTQIMDVQGIIEMLAVSCSVRRLR
jgi:hypothetical protein